MYIYIYTHIYIYIYMYMYIYIYVIYNINYYLLKTHMEQSINCFLTSEKVQA